MAQTEDGQDRFRGRDPLGTLLLAGARPADFRGEQGRPGLGRP